MNRLRARISRQLDPAMRERPGLSWPNRALAVLILAAVLSGVLQTEPALSHLEPVFFAFEHVFLVIFLIEYCLRVWVSIENPANRSRWRYMLRPVSLIDLLVLISMASLFFGAQASILRLARLLRLLLLARLGRFSDALAGLGRAVSRRRFELFISAAAAGFLLLVTSTLLYMVEGESQPEAFGSIPRAMWWSVATLTTVGYGDIVPVTPIGRVFAGLSAIAGIGLIALPAGILAAAFSEVISEKRESRKK